ncbi:polysaccharide pyruvyl transferase family protein [Halovenus marina]|uniref:polysaccharide pyruvyl transferase family protein n=1 Tax=Halovenus marina TaxID=3396621 RepID=UPI003F574D76
MYTIVSTFPADGSANVGDKLIEHAVERIVEAERGPTEFFTVFRENPLDDHLDRINDSDAVLLPAFAIRDLPLYPETYRLTENLSDITVPLIPIGSNYNVYPGDEQTRAELDFSQETREVLEHVAGQVKSFSCREQYTCDVLNAHGIDNTLLTGDPAWFDPDRIGDSMRRPNAVEQVVFTPPLSPYYVEQATALVEMLTDLFPDARRILSIHLADADTADDDTTSEKSAALTEDVAEKNRRIRAAADEHGFEQVDAGGDLTNIGFYEDCDLHVGYECHAHASFIRRRIPSVLVAEDARGVGFADTLGVGGFRGFVRAQSSSRQLRKEVTSGYCTTLTEYSLAPARNDLATDVRRFLTREIDRDFQRYAGLGNYLDAMYTETMRPFVKNLP